MHVRYLVSSLLAVTVFGLPAAARQATPAETVKPRQIFRGTPIVSALEPGDRVVVVKELTEDPLYADGGETLSVPQEIKILQGCENLLAVDSVKAEGYLADDGKWIRTHVRGTVKQVLRATTLHVSKGQPVRFEHDGGEVVINGVTVRAGAAPVWTADATYLACLEHSDLLKTMGLGRVFTVDREGKLAPLALRSGVSDARSALYGQTLSSIASRVKKR